MRSPSSTKERASTRPGVSRRGCRSASSSREARRRSTRRPAANLFRIAPDRPRHCIPAGGIHDPEGTEDRAAPRRLRLRLGRWRSSPRGVLRERILGRARRDAAGRNAVDLAPQILRARRAGATALVVWGQPATIAAAITAARSSGWNVPFFTPPAGDDPFVRQQLADHPSWVDGGPPSPAAGSPPRSAPGRSRRSNGNTRLPTVSTASA